jgi:hypothetical protein
MFLTVKKVTKNDLFLKADNLVVLIVNETPKLTRLSSFFVYSYSLVVWHHIFDFNLLQFVEPRLRSRYRNWLQAGRPRGQNVSQNNWPLGLDVNTESTE